MLSTRLIQLIESHAQELTRGVVSHLKSHPRTPALHSFSDAELRERAYSVYRHMGDWVSGQHEEEIRKTYEEFGRSRAADGIPLAEVIYALVVTKNHLLDFTKSSTEGSTALEVFGERDLILMVSRFFDSAIYFTAVGYGQAKPDRVVV